MLLKLIFKKILLISIFLLLYTKISSQQTVEYDDIDIEKDIFIFGYYNNNEIKLQNSIIKKLKYNYLYYIDIKSDIIGKFNKIDTLKILKVIKPDSIYSNNLPFYEFSIGNSYFTKNFSISKTIFDKVFIYDCEFNSNANMSNMEVNQGFSIKSNIFRKPPYFFLSVFKENFTSINCKFDSGANFSKCVFFSEAIFNISSFHFMANFSNSIFNSKVKFINVDFGDRASFRGCTFNDEVDFTNASLPTVLDFSKVRINTKEIDFTFAQPDAGNHRCNINLYATDINKIKLQYFLFKLWFPQKDSITYEQRYAIYDALLNKLRKDGFWESYKILDLEFREFKYSHDHLLLFHYIQKYWWNYGYNKEWIILWIISLLTIFSVITFFKIEYLLNNVYIISFLEYEIIKNKYNRINILHFFLKKLMYSFTYTFIVFFGLKLNLEKIKSLNIWLIYILIIYSSGLICIGYLINFIISK